MLFTRNPEISIIHRELLDFRTEVETNEYKVRAISRGYLIIIILENIKHVNHIDYCILLCPVIINMNIYKEFSLFC